PVEGKIHDNFATTRDTLVVSNLAPGQYLLTVDGQPVAEGNHLQWAEGVAVDASPAHQAAEAYRRQVNDKNLQFTYSWKALNQVHIVGERRSSASGRSLPEEVIAFRKLADQRDEALQARIELKTRDWRLVPQ
ncbi:MAG: dehydrogenase, partial [Verrucomicrobiota bacterium]|nr:dehydrogenase [Verrucomicrobiota bacterium]